MEGKVIGCRTTSRGARKPICVADYSRKRREREIPTGFFPPCVIILLQVSAGDTRVGAEASIKAAASWAAEEQGVFTPDFNSLENDPTKRSAGWLARCQTAEGESPKTKQLENKTKKRWRNCRDVKKENKNLLSFFFICVYAFLLSSNLDYRVSLMVTWSNPPFPHWSWNQILS